MELEISQSVFQEALSRVQGVIDRRSTVALLSHVLVEALENTVRLTASDNEISLTAEYPATISRPGSLCLPARQLHEIIKNLPDNKPVVLKEINNSWLEITCGTSYFRVVGLSSDGFPGMPRLRATSEIKLPAGGLGELIRAVYFSISTDDTRYGLNGALLSMDDEDNGSGLRLVSTDGHRLSISRYHDRLEGTLAGSYLLPRKGLQELRKLCDVAPSDGEVQVRLADDGAIFDLGQMSFFMRLLEGEFPDYRQVVPERSQRELTLDKGELTRALRRVSILSSEKTHSVRFVVEADRLQLLTSSPDLGEAREEVPARVVGGALSIGFNARYFLDALDVLAESEVLLLMGDSLHPALIRGARSDQHMYVVMPMRIE